MNATFFKNQNGSPIFFSVWGQKRPILRNWAQFLVSVFFRLLKMRKNFVFGCVLVFFPFFFHAKSGTTNNYRTDKKSLSIVIRTTLKNV